MNAFTYTDSFPLHNVFGLPYLSMCPLCRFLSGSMRCRAEEWTDQEGKCKGPRRVRSPVRCNRQGWAGWTGRTYRCMYCECLFFLLPLPPIHWACWMHWKREIGYHCNASESMELPIVLIGFMEHHHTWWIRIGRIGECRCRIVVTGFMHAYAWAGDGCDSTMRSDPYDPWNHCKHIVNINAQCSNEVIAVAAISSMQDDTNRIGGVDRMYMNEMVVHPAQE